VRLEIDRLSFSYNGNGRVLTNIKLEVLPGEVTIIIGPNASGKSTLMKCIAGMLKPDGDISIDGKKISETNKNEVKRLISYLPQENSSRAMLTVFEAVLLGRIESLSWRVGKDDLDLTLDALRELGIENLASRYLYELSGGQKQMVSMAQVLVRQPKLLLLDEPLNGLDLRHELETLELIRKITSQRKITTVIALHNLNLVARYADKVAILKEGHIKAYGEPLEVLTSNIIGMVYGVHCRITNDDGFLQITPISPIQ
jgi:iron complex transport system ATP-binding protein